MPGTVATGTLSITPPVAASKSPPASAVKPAGGEDWIEGVGHIWWQARFAPVMGDLEALKLAAQEQGRAMLLSLPGHPEPALVQRNGLRIGGENGTQFEYRLLWRGIVFGLGRREGIGTPYYNLYAKASGSTCLLLGTPAVAAAISDLSEALGGMLMQFKLSRVDACLDLPGLDPDKLSRPFKRRAFVTTARSRDTYEESDGITGFTIGRGDLRLVVYDKLRKALADGDRVYLEAMKRHRWGGGLPEWATRVELKLGRAALKAHGIDGLGDWLDKRAGAISHALTEHFRFVSPTASRLRRSPTSKLWRQVQAGFAAWAGTAPADLDPLPRSTVDEAMYWKQVAGCITTAMAQRGVTAQSKAEIIAYAARRLNEEMIEDEWLADVQRKSLAFPPAAPSP